MARINRMIHTEMDAATGRLSDNAQTNGFSRFAWVVLAYNIGVVLWGAYVRATGSGAGCGAHWPLCNGEIIPASPGTARLIEYSHRVSSGLTLLLVAALVIWAWRIFPKGHSVRLGATLAGIFTITEALVGAGLVLFQLVAENASMARAASIAVHLTNTFLLLASLALTAFWATRDHPVLPSRPRTTRVILGLGLVGILVLGVSGAVTALGDTLFPAETLARGLEQDVASTANFLVRLRVIHPVLAVGVGAFLIASTRLLTEIYPAKDASLWGRVTIALVLFQWLAGLANIYLLAPIWLQLTHLLLADLVWIAFVLFSASVGEISRQGSAFVT